MADAPDSKSGGRKVVRVRLSPPGPPLSPPAGARPQVALQGPLPNDLLHSTSARGSPLVEPEVTGDACDRDLDEQHDQQDHPGTQGLSANEDEVSEHEDRRDRATRGGRRSAPSGSGRPGVRRRCRLRQGRAAHRPGRRSRPAPSHRRVRTVPRQSRASGGPRRRRSNRARLDTWASRHEFGPADVSRRAPCRPVVPQTKARCRARSTATRDDRPLTISDSSSSVAATRGAGRSAFRGSDAHPPADASCVGSENWTCHGLDIPATAAHVDVIDRGGGTVSGARRRSTRESLEVESTREAIAQRACPRTSAPTTERGDRRHSAPSRGAGTSDQTGPVRIMPVTRRRRLGHGPADACPPYPSPLTTDAETTSRYRTHPQGASPRPRKGGRLAPPVATVTLVSVPASARAWRPGG